MIVYTLLSLMAITKLCDTGIGRNHVNIEISMTNKELENSKHTTPSNIEYWSAREIQSILGYSEWRKFDGVIEKAMEACEGIGASKDNHFVGSAKMVQIGSGAERKKDDYTLSRYACYLIAMNGNTQKPEICAAQAYFAVQTRRMEITDKALDVQERIQLRDRIKDSNKKLNDAAKDAGVLNYGAFHNAGY